MNLLSLPNLSTKRLEALQSVGIQQASDLLLLFPYRYLDRSHVAQINLLSGSGEEATVVGKVLSINEAGFGKKKRLEVIIGNDEHELKGVWFRGAGFFKKYFEKGEVVAFFGQVKRYGKHLSIAHPEVDKITAGNSLSDFTRIAPIYPGNQAFSKARITSKLIHSWIQHILKHTAQEEFLPEDILQEFHFPERTRALHMIHNPENHSDHKTALDRFKFEELFLFQMGMEKIRYKVVERKSGHLFTNTKGYTSKFFNEVLPFELTEGQKKSLKDIKDDVQSGSQMNRLIQGDVGAGKTIVAIGSLLMALDNGFQAAFVAPTEILAEQHYRTLIEYLTPLGVNIRLLVGGQKTSLRTDILTDIEGGNCQIVVGTHAVIQEGVNFHKLGLAVIDEQHRFGVKQRAGLLSKGDHPHMLVMSATPIPRSLAMTVYGDLDVSIIQGLPAGRKPIKTAIRSDKDRPKVFSFIADEISNGGQIYIVYPLVEESEALDLKDATAGFENLQRHFPDIKIGLIHGRMKQDEKDNIMKLFIQNEIKILVSTTVIEVGVDVPNASVMVVEHAERFGLSQLHQLRGRIGRGERQSYCILFKGVKLSNAGRFRLQTMSETNDGFKIAEADLKLRGPGDFLGTKQSGVPEFRFADLVEDQFVLAQAKEKAREIIYQDPELEQSNHLVLKTVFLPYFKEKEQFYGMG